MAELVDRGGLDSGGAGRIVPAPARWVPGASTFDEAFAGEAPEDLGTLNAALIEQVRLFDAALQNMRQGLCMFDAQSRLLVANRQYQRMFDLLPGTLRRGMTQREICALLIANRVYPPSETLDGIQERTRLALGSADDLPVLRDLADGRVISVRYRIMDGGGWVSTFEDVTEQRRSAARINHLAHHDALTDLANTRALRRRYRNLADLDDTDRPLLAMCYVDLDRFKFVNDTYGHAVGDELLQAVAERLRLNAHHGDILARLGGDEFALVQRVANDATAAATAARIVDVLSKPYDVSGTRLDIGASVGVATREIDGSDLDPLLHDADLALRHAKSEGRGTVSVFDAGMSEVARARRLLEIELQQALAEGQFAVHYQPLVDVLSDRIVGVEALVRWLHPERGLQPPLSFIPVMEETGLIVALGRWVMRQSCLHALGWDEHVVVAVNVSTVQLKQRGFAEVVLAILRETGLPAHRLEIEITESSLLEESEVTQGNLAIIHDAGVRIAMDDFGTGYSSLNHLRRFPIDKIKIDRSFMKDAETSADARAIIRAVAGLGNSLGLITVVEGVETVRQLEFARSEGVGQVQGYLLGRPQSESEVTRLISRGPGAVPTTGIAASR